LCPRKSRQKGREIGRRRIDSFVEDELIFELKALEALARIYEAQTINSLRRRTKRERDECLLN
jgi:hypothetical protein